MDLSELQRYFARVATSTSGPPDDLSEVFKDSPRLPARELMRIYNRGYHYRLLGVLASVFERTHAALGAAEFERLGLLYLAQYPSQHPAVERVGRHFAEYLAASADGAAEVADLARLEWTRLLALVAPDDDRIDVSAIDATRFPTQRVRFVHSLHVLDLSAVALALFNGEASPADAGARRRIVVSRVRHTVTQDVVPAEEFSALALARAGEPMSRVCAVFDTGDEIGDISRAFAVISSWFGRGWVAELRA